MSVTLTAEARARLDKHLDAVEAALTAAGNSREQRRAVVDDLEAQVLDMLAARSQTPASDDVEAVLAQLDPPSAYANADPAPSVPQTSPSVPPILRPRFCRTAVAATTGVIGSFVLIIVANAMLWSMLTPYYSGGSIAVVVIQLVILLLIGIGLIGTTLGWVAFVRIRLAKSALRGIAFALFAGLFYPVILSTTILIKLLIAGHR